VAVLSAVFNYNIAQEKNRQELLALFGRVLSTGEFKSGFFALKPGSPLLYGDEKWTKNSGRPEKKYP